MNNEQQQIIDEAYESFMLQNGFKYENGLLVGKMGGLNQLNVTYWLTKEEFLNKCKTDPEFSKKWGLKIEERELNDDELNIFNLLKQTFSKLITITYKEQTIESYE